MGYYHTTLEFDHQYFNNHLKISIDEIIISLNGKADFMNSFIDDSFDLEEESNAVDPIQFIDDIENDRFWENQLGNYDNYMNNMLSTLNV